MPADTLIYDLGEPEPPFQSRNEPLINKVKTSGWLNNVWIISFCGDGEKKKTQEWCLHRKQYHKNQSAHFPPKIEFVW